MMRKCSRQSIHSLLAFIHPHTALVIHARARSHFSSAQSKAINTANPGSLGTQAYCTTPISLGRSKRHLVEHHSSAWSECSQAQYAAGIYKNSSSDYCKTVASATTSGTKQPDDCYAYLTLIWGKRIMPDQPIASKSLRSSKKNSDLSSQSKRSSSSRSRMIVLKLWSCLSADQTKDLTSLVYLLRNTLHNHMIALSR